MEKWLKHYLGDCTIIPSVATSESLKYIVEHSNFPCIMLKMGDINTIRNIVTYIHKHHKFVMIHMDSVKGISKDKAGIHYFKRIGVDIIITMKSQHIRMIKDEGIKAILGTFLIDSASVQLTIQNLRTSKPDAVVVMPMTVPDQIYEKIITCSEAPVIAGGLGIDKEIIDHVLTLPVEACAITDQALLKEYDIVPLR
ncbi:MAG: glycerol-3-phosphate responsive antiterminator [Clostridiales bacterium]|nr:glycerol-3-phosphate responsive antiterminator [Clostridiales bacterium]